MGDLELHLNPNAFQAKPLDRDESQRPDYMGDEFCYIFGKSRRTRFRMTFPQNKCDELERPWSLKCTNAALPRNCESALNASKVALRPHTPVTKPLPD